MSTLEILIASLYATGTVFTLTSCGIYLSISGLLPPPLRKGLAIISQQLLIPALLFSKLLFCDQDWSDDECPSIKDDISDAWFMLFWPFYVVFCGCACGIFLCKLTDAKQTSRPAIIACLAFSNSTGLPITLLHVIHNSFKQTELGKVDPTIYLVLYLILYPVLQWGIGRYLLAGEVDDEKKGLIDEIDGGGDLAVCEDEVGVELGNDDESSNPIPESSSLSSSRPLPRTNLYKKPAMPPSKFPFLKPLLSNFLQPPIIASILGLILALTPLRSLLVDTDDRDSDAMFGWVFDGIYEIGKAAVPINMIVLGGNIGEAFKEWRDKITSESTSNHNSSSSSNPNSSPSDEVEETKVNTNDDNNQFTNQIHICIVIIKLILLPIIGILSTLVLKNILPISPKIDGSFYLAAMIVFITPSANNLVIMMEVYGKGGGGDVTRSVFYQYLVSPIVMTVFMAVIVMIATKL